MYKYNVYHLGVFVRSIQANSAYHAISMLTKGRCDKSQYTAMNTETPYVNQRWV
jgi:hypothetical protein